MSTTPKKLNPTQIKDLTLYNLGVTLMLLEKDTEVPARLREVASAAATMAKVAISITPQGTQLNNEELIKYLQFLGQCQKERQDAVAEAKKEKEEADANHQAVAKPDKQDNNEAASSSPDA